MVGQRRRKRGSLRSAGGAFSVSGPNIERLVQGSVGAAVGVAQGAAQRLDEPGTVYVRKLTGEALYRVDLDDKRVVWTTPAAAVTARV